MVEPMVVTCYYKFVKQEWVPDCDWSDSLSMRRQAINQYHIRMVYCQATVSSCQTIAWLSLVTGPGTHGCHPIPWAYQPIYRLTERPFISCNGKQTQRNNQQKRTSTKVNDIASGNISIDQLLNPKAGNWSLIDWLIDWLIHSFIHSFIYPFIHSIIN